MVIKNVKDTTPKILGMLKESSEYITRERVILSSDVVTSALTSVCNALQKPETVYDLMSLLLTSRPWFEQPGHLPTKRRTITQPFWMN